MTKQLEFEESKIRQYEIFFRRVCNSVVQRTDFDRLNKEGKSFFKKTKERLHIESTEWRQRITTCLDVIWDSDTAIVHFQNLSRRKKNEQGQLWEEYLKLYGVLSAVYIQRSSLLNLHEIFKLPHKKSTEEKFERLNIIFLRHCISAHPIDCLDEGDSKPYKIDRSSIADYGNIIVRDQNNNAVAYDVYWSILEYKSNAEDLFDEICQKMLRHLYNSEHLTTLVNELNTIKS